MELATALAALALAALPAGLCLVNLAVYRRPRPVADDRQPPMSVLIPARNEAERIGKALDGVLADPHPTIELVVMDDDSTDDTAAVVRARASKDSRLRLERAPPLPEGWNGKQHACFALARAARHDIFVFLDADVALERGALAACAGALETSGVALVSGFPRQITRSFLERLLIPLINFVLLGFLPIPAMRRSMKPAFAAGCGQLMVARRDAYEASGGHAAIRSSRHDGVTLPRAFRRAGHATDLFDATALASVRMYRSGKEVIRGITKNATEGMASPKAILPWTVLLLGGQVLPLVWVVVDVLGTSTSPATAYAAGAVVLGLLTRAALALRFRQPLDSVLLHPLGVTVLVLLQYVALVRHLVGRPVAWRGRTGS